MRITQPFKRLSRLFIALVTLLGLFSCNIKGAEMPLAEPVLFRLSVYTPNRQPDDRTSFANGLVETYSNAQSHLFDGGFQWTSTPSGRTLSLVFYGVRKTLKGDGLNIRKDDIVQLELRESTLDPFRAVAIAVMDVVPSDFSYGSGVKDFEDAELMNKFVGVGLERKLQGVKMDYRRVSGNNDIAYFIDDLVGFHANPSMLPPSILPPLLPTPLTGLTYNDFYLPLQPLSEIFGKLLEATDGLMPIWDYGVNPSGRLFFDTLNGVPTGAPITHIETFDYEDVAPLPLPYPAGRYVTEGCLVVATQMGELTPAKIKRFGVYIGKDYLPSPVAYCYQSPEHTTHRESIVRAFSPSVNINRDYSDYSANLTGTWANAANAFDGDLATTYATNTSSAVGANKSSFAVSSIDRELAYGARLTYELDPTKLIGQTYPVLRLIIGLGFDFLMAEYPLPISLNGEINELVVIFPPTQPLTLNFNYSVSVELDVEEYQGTSPTPQILADAIKIYGLKPLEIDPVKAEPYARSLTYLPKRYPVEVEVTQNNDTRLNPILRGYVEPFRYLNLTNTPDGDVNGLEVATIDYALEPDLGLRTLIKTVTANPDSESEYLKRYNDYQLNIQELSSVRRSE